MRIAALFLWSLVITFLFSACSKDILCKSGDGNRITKELNLSSLDGIDMQIAADVVIKQGTVQKVTLKGDKNVAEEISTVVKNGIWVIKFTDGCFEDYDMAIEVTVPNLRLAAISGSGDILIEDFADQSELDLIISGSGNISISKFDGAHYINSVISGSGDITANDTLTLAETDLSISGSGNYNAFPWKTDDCEIKVSGSGDCSVHVISNLDIIVSGSAKIYYKGDPSIRQSISGSATIENRN